MRRDVQRRFRRTHAAAKEELPEIGRSAVDVIEGSVRKRAGGDRPPEIRIEHLGCFDDVGLPDIA
jgi:hypothetical protein